MPMNPEGDALARAVVTTHLHAAPRFSVEKNPGVDILVVELRRGGSDWQ
jgi:hypothetical protein